MAEGFLLLDDVEEAARWLDHGISGGLGTHRALTRHNTLWMTVLDHPALRPVFERLRVRALEYAEIAVAPRALALAHAERAQ